MQVKAKRVMASVIPQITIAAVIGTVVIAVALSQTNLITASVAATADASVLIKAASFLRAECKNVKFCNDLSVRIRCPQESCLRITCLSLNQCLISCFIACALWRHKH